MARDFCADQGEEPKEKQRYFEVQQRNYARIDPPRRAMYGWQSNDMIRTAFFIRSHLSYTGKHISFVFHFDHTSHAVQLTEKPLCG